MDNLGKLVPKLDLIKELYQLEAFKPLDQFLRSLKDEALKDLLQSQHEDAIARSLAIARINLVGTIIDLPKVIRAVKDTMEYQVQIQKGLQKQQED